MWGEILNNVNQSVAQLISADENIQKIISGTNNAVSSGQHLDPKTKELIAIAIAVTTRCEGCIAAHVKKASELGVTKEELTDTMAIAIALNAGAAIVYSAKAVDAWSNL
ncbi:carboxymuconolactone decarboxylase family protein [Buttiauxella gaviniae]|uniref:carboxymuconolactone decarboxylase family protein n=1 Tax=Buttiauxella gaviniae TaxID=82990 RepID=UPI0039754B72